MNKQINLKVKGSDNMGWDIDFEVSDVKIIKDLSFEVIKKDCDKDIEKFGLRIAIENVVVGTPYFIEECDNAFAILIESFSVINTISSSLSIRPTIMNRDYALSSVEWDLKYKEDEVILKLNDELKSKINTIKERIHKSEQKLLDIHNWFSGNELMIEKKCLEAEIRIVNKALETGRILLNLQEDKSVHDIFLREFEALAALYCKHTGKEKKDIRKELYMRASAWDFALWSSNTPITRKNRWSRPYTYFSSLKD